MRLRIAPQRQHEGVTVDDAGRRRKKRPLRLELRLKRSRLLPCEPDEIEDSIRFRPGLKRREARDLALVGRNDELAAAPMRHAIFAAEAIQHLLSLGAQTRFGQAGRIINAGVNDLAVSRTYARADGVFRLDNDDLPPRARERSGDRQPNNPGADNETLDRVHARLLQCRPDPRASKESPIGYQR